MTLLTSPGLRHRQCAQYGIVAASLARLRVRYGLAFGAMVWAGDYVILPAAKL